MKKIISVIVLLVIALIALTSYNGSESKTKSNDHLLAEIKTENPGGVIFRGGEKKKQD